MYSESQESYNDCLSLESDLSYKCPNCFSKLNFENPRKIVPAKTASSVKEKIKYFSGNSQNSFYSSSESDTDTKILSKESPAELDKKIYKSTTEILKTVNGNLFNYLFLI